MDQTLNARLAELARSGPERPRRADLSRDAPRRPLVAPALACLSAAVLAPLLPESFRLAAMGLAAISVLALLLFSLRRIVESHGRRFAAPGPAASLVLCGVLALLTVSRARTPSSLRPSPGLHRLEGRLGRARLDSADRLRVRLSAPRLDDRELASLDGPVDLIWSDAGVPPAEAEARRVSGLVEARHFRGRLWLFAEGRALRLAERDSGLPSELLRLMRGRVAEAIGPGESGSDRALLHSLLLGRRDRLDRDTRELFRRTGTAHVLAVSGLHVGLVALFGIALASALGAGPRLRAGLAAALILIYLALVGPRPSAIRAGVLAFGLLLAGLTERRRDAWNLLALAGLGLILYDPAAPFDIGCQLSFLTTAGLVAAAPRVLMLTTPRTSRDDSRGAAQERGGRAALKSTWRGLLRSAALSAIAITVSLPITIAVFGLVAPAGLIANTFAVPVCLLLLASGLLAVLIAILDPTLGALVMTAPRALAGLLVGGLRLFDQPALAPIEISPLDPLRSPLWSAVLLALGLGFALMLRVLARSRLGARGLVVARARRFGPGLVVGLGALGILKLTRGDPGAVSMPSRSLASEAAKPTRDKRAREDSQSAAEHDAGLEGAIWVGREGRVAWRRCGSWLRRELQLPAPGEIRRYGELVLARPQLEQVELRLVSDPPESRRLTLVLDTPLIPGPGEAKPPRVLRVERQTQSGPGSESPLYPASLQPGQAWRIPLAAPRDAEPRRAVTGAVRP